MTMDRADASDEAKRADATSQLGMSLFLVTLGILFASSLFGYLVIWYRSEAWGNPVGESLPPTLWFSTVVLVACSLAHHRALTSIRADRGADLRFWLSVTLWLGALFVGCQCYAWHRLIEMRLPPQAKNLYAFGFYMLTALHALHVLGGLIGLLVVWYRAGRKAYTMVRHAAVWRSATYWHFLDAVWLVLLGTLVLTVR
jgi:cytochrome c oxidase subunit 3